MTIRNRTAYWQVGATLTALSVALAACDDKSDTNQDVGPVAADDAGTPNDEPDTPPEEENVPAATPACPGIFDQLSDSCGSCICDVDKMLAPACQGPCWDFITCASVSAMGPCAKAAAGGDATRPELEACTLEQCGPYLVVPGAAIVRSYVKIIDACTIASESGPAACAGDLARLAAGLEK